MVHLPRTGRRRFLFLAGGLAAASAVPLLRRSGLAKAERTSWALGSDVSIQAYHEDRAAAEQAVTDAFAELELVEEVMSLYRPHSQLCRLNRDGALENPHPYLLEVLRAADDTYSRSSGAFDATVQPLWEVYAAAKKAGGLPEAAALEAAHSRVDWRRVEISPERVRFRGKGMAITLNGIAQGFAADRVRAALQARGVACALVNAGELAALGTKPDGEKWKAGIQHPRHPDAYIALTAIEDRFLATSGDYNTTFTADFRHNHIVDPRTGASPVEFSSVSILAPTGTLADALSTSVFVMGVEKGLELVRSTPRTDAFFVLKDGKTLATNGFPRLS